MKPILMQTEEQHVVLPIGGMVLNYLVEQCASDVHARLSGEIVGKTLNEWVAAGFQKLDVIKLCYYGILSYDPIKTARCTLTPVGAKAVALSLEKNHGEILVYINGEIVLDDD